MDQEIDALMEFIDALNEQGVTWELSDLAQVNEAIKALRVVRDDIVSQLRANEHAWSAIAAATGVPISTWRRRHTRSLVESGQILDR